MILVDTSVRGDHLRRRDTALAVALNANTVAVHPFVTGELACGELKARQQVLSLLASLPRVHPQRMTKRCISWNIIACTGTAWATSTSIFSPPQRCTRTPVFGHATGV